METKANELFKSIVSSLNKGLLGRALRQARAFSETFPRLAGSAELDDIERDYSLMTGYYARGYADPRRADVYSGLLQRLYRSASDMFMDYRVKASPFFADCLRRSAGAALAPENVKAELENFVTGMAMLSLEAGEERAARTQELCRSHTRFMQRLFCHIVISRQWTDAETSFYTETMLSPLVDANDAQLITSAVTVAAINNMDAGKFAALMTTCLKAADERVRQRALAGWVLTLASGVKCLPQVKRLIASAVKAPRVVSEIADLQRQLMFCLNAEKDNDTIRKDIMPVLMKNNNLNITRSGITEKDDDPMEDVLDPDAVDRRMEEMESTFQKMMNMQKAGSDIYFGGFSRMKRFPFFYVPANWFMPFFKQHPDIGKPSEKLTGTSLLDNLLSNGMFCESDKYSFAIALGSIVDRLPASIIEMLGSKEALGPHVTPEEQLTPAYIRRLALQDLYRFFRLYPQREDFTNPFDEANAAFIANPLLCKDDSGKTAPEVNGTLLDLAAFMFKHKNKAAMKAVLDQFEDNGNARCWMLRGMYELEMNNDAETASADLRTAHSLQPGNKRVISLLARARFMAGKYGEAAESYAELYQKDTENKTATLNYSIALSKAKRYDEAASLLYKLSFESGDSSQVTRVLAWTLMGQGKLEQADKAYGKLLSGPDTETGDYLNAGYCRWFMGNVPAAADRLRRFIDVSRSLSPAKQAVDIEAEMRKDLDILRDHGISEVDFNLMVDTLS